MRRMFVGTTVMTTVLLGTIVPGHASVTHMSILVTQTDPLSQPGTLAGILDGTISGRAHTEEAPLGLDHLEIGGVMYQLPPNRLDRASLSSSTDDETLPALLTVTAEPSTLLLVGTGLAGLAGMVRRRLARRH